MDRADNMRNVAEMTELIDKTDTYIPLLQRNYKWSMECAAEFAEELWEGFQNNPEKSYQLNMITIYRDVKNKRLQIIDGQQRLITLKLFLAFLDNEADYDLNYKFERDRHIVEREEQRKRRYFIDHVLKKSDKLVNCTDLSVDVGRLYDNFIAMIVPLSFRFVYAFYEECLETAKSGQRKKEEIFKERFEQKRAELLRDRGTDGYVSHARGTYDQLSVNEQECEDIIEWCQKFQSSCSDPQKKDEISNDEIRESEYAYEFQRWWGKKVKALIEEIEHGWEDERIMPHERRKALAQYIRDKVEMLYHETTSEPIEEFLNINENKTRFVISDHIRANMICDNPVDGDLDDETKNRNQQNRDEILRLFSALANYLYNADYADIWELVKKRYDDFDKHSDINRLKILFCDKYIGTSTKGYTFETEIKRLRYLEMILKSLADELKAENGILEKRWNTYNAVSALLECKADYRFFSLFTQDDISKETELKDVTARERFCFFEKAYEISEASSDFWDISYFLQSQLYVEKYGIKKASNLPEIKEKENRKRWYCTNRGNEKDELHDCIRQLIQKIKGSEGDG